MKTNDLSENVKYYFKELRNNKSLTKKEELDLLKDYKENGNISSRDKVIKANLKYTVKIANNFRDKGVDFPELISEANATLIETIDKFDVRQNVKFMSYAKWWIIQRLQALISKQYKMPLSELPQENNTDDLTENEDTEMTYDTQVLGKNDVFAESFDDEHNTESRTTILNKITEDLNERELSMVKMYYGLTDGKEHTLEEIGKEFNLTKERVRQIIDKGMRKIRCKSITVDVVYE